VSATNTPIIGILTQPASLSLGKSYIAASYVKYVEGGGAQAIPVFYSSTQDELRATFNSINGLLFPGGAANLDNTPLYKATEFLYNLALEANDNGDYFPIEGHCMGFELLNIITSKNMSILTPFEAENISMPLFFYPDYQTSRLFANAPKDIINTFTNQAVTLNNHHYGVGPQSYQTNPNLNSFYQVISHNTDKYGKVFVSTIEGKKYPIYALQWHAEKPLYEWNDWEDINHSTASIEAMQYVSDFFISEARKSNHKFLSAAAQTAALIYNYDPTYTGLNPSSDFVQTYYFNK